MRLAAFSIGGPERASSRLRSYYLFSEAAQFGLIVKRPVRFRDALDCDVIHIQKILSYRVLPPMFFCRLLGKKVVFDIDDQPPDRQAFLVYWLSLALATLVTTDTAARRNYWRRWLPFKRIVVIPGAADTPEASLVLNDGRMRTDPTRLFWIGYPQNFDSLRELLPRLREQSRYRLLACTDSEAIPALQNRYPWVAFTPWHDGVTIDSTIDAAYMILNHRHDADSVLKSENKMVLALLAGFVPVVSSTPAYTNLARIIDAEWLLFDRLEDALRIVESLKDMDRPAFFARVFPRIEEYCSRRRVLEKLLDAVAYRRGS